MGDREREQPKSERPVLRHMIADSREKKEAKGWSELNTKKKQKNKKKQKKQTNEQEQPKSERPVLKHMIADSRKAKRKRS
jgi:hypothetical protein